MAIVVVVGGDKCVILFAILSGGHQQHIKSILLPPSTAEKGRLGSEFQKQIDSKELPPLMVAHCTKESQYMLEFERSSDTPIKDEKLQSFISK